MEQLILVRPGPQHEAQVMACREEMLRAGDNFAGCAGLEQTDSYTEWLRFEERLRARYGAGYVPSRVFLALRGQGGRLVGILDYRRPLTEFLLQFGGNIGYSVRPDERGNGYAARMLQLILPVCRSFGEDRVLLTCDKGNEASRRTILRCGGVLENEVEDTAGLGKSGWIQRYWVPVPGAGEENGGIGRAERSMNDACGLRDCRESPGRENTN